MPILTSKPRAQGGTVTTTIPIEAARRMGVSPGDEIYWVADNEGGYHVSRSNPTRASMLRARAGIMDEYRDVFALLAK